MVYSHTEVLAAAAAIVIVDLAVRGDLSDSWYSGAVSFVPFCAWATSIKILTDPTLADIEVCNYFCNKPDGAFSTTSPHPPLPEDAQSINYEEERFYLPYTLI